MRCCQISKKGLRYSIRNNAHKKGIVKTDSSRILSTSICLVKVDVSTISELHLQSQTFFKMNYPTKKLNTATFRMCPNHATVMKNTWDELFHLYSDLSSQSFAATKFSNCTVWRAAKRSELIIARTVAPIPPGSPQTS